jgi:hypothetical protein
MITRSSPAMTPRARSIPSWDSALARLDLRVELDANPLAVAGSTQASAERIPISDLRRAPRMHPRVSSHVIHYRFVS